jgi:hypothetical protein
VLGKLGRHERALAIYMSILGDVPRAIQYCDKVFVLQYTWTYMILMSSFAKINAVSALHFYGSNWDHKHLCDYVCYLIWF